MASPKKRLDPPKMNEALIQQLRTALTDILASFTLYHYAAEALVALFFLLFLVLGIAFHRHTIIALIMILLSLFTLLTGPVIAYVGTESIVRATPISDLKTQQLLYSDDVVLTGTITNDGLVDIKECVLNISLYRPDNREWKQAFNRLRPVRKASVAVKTPIAPGESLPLRAAVNGIRLDFVPGVDISTRCH